MWAIILHGGAKTIEAAEEERNRSGCRAALEAGSAILRAGGSSTDAVEAAVRVLEDDGTFNAGRGSALNADGEAEMCAAIMEGAKLNVGAVTVVKGVRHPISIARALLLEEQVLLAAEGARRFAAEKNGELSDPVDALAKPVGAEARDTVGCIALDSRGQLAVAVSTGGLDGAPPGRVGDSPLTGCGYYADDAVGAVCCSGDGEYIARMMLAARVMHELDDLRPGGAVASGLKAMSRVGGEAGIIALAPDGTPGWAHSSSHFAVALATSAHPEPQVYLAKDEEDDDG